MLNKVFLIYLEFAFSTNKYLKVNYVDKFSNFHYQEYSAKRLDPLQWMQSA